MPLGQMLRNSLILRHIEMEASCGYRPVKNCLKGISNNTPPSLGLESQRHVTKVPEGAEELNMAQMRFFDVENRYASLDAKNDPLMKINALVPWEAFRSRLEQVWRKPADQRKSNAGCKPWDVIVMFKAIILCALYNLSDDQVVENRGHRFVRYADDCNIYLRSRRAGERVMASVTRFLARRLKLTVNMAKSAVARPATRSFLGFSFTAGRRGKRRIAPQALARFKVRVRGLTHCTKSVRLSRLVAELSRYLCRVAGLLRFLRDPLGPAQPRQVDQSAASRRRLAPLEARSASL